MYQSDSRSQSTVKAVCGFCGSEQFNYDRCAGCGGASLQVIEERAGPDTQEREILLKQNIKAQNHMNLIGAVLAIGLVFFIYSSFNSTENKPASATTENATQKQFMLVEFAPKPLKVVAPTVSVGDMDSRNQEIAARFSKPSKPSKPTVPERCRFDSVDLADEFVVYAGRAVGKKLHYQINGQGRVARQVDVTVNQTDRPAVLMLDAPTPTIWNIKRTVGSEIKAVFFNGNNTQVLAGLDDSLPIFANTQQNDYPCGRFKITKDNTRVLDSVANAMFGVDVDAISSESHYQLRFGSPVNYTHRYITDGVKPESYRDPNLPLPGKEGLAQAVRNGQIRPATRADTERWVKSAMRQGYSAEKLAEIQDLYRYNAYLVVKPFTYPPALSGSNRVSFFINYGVPLPSGSPGHSDVYDLNSGTCQGTVCSVMLSRW